MTNQSSPTRTRNLVAALLAGGLITSLSACGATTTASPVSETKSITTAAGSPLVQCGMAQLTPRLNSGDPVLARGSYFFDQLDQSQQVPPAVQKVYTADLNALNETQKHEVLLFLSSLNECPNVSPQLQQSVLDAFDQLTPQQVAASDSSSGSSSNSAAVQSEVIRGDDSTYDDSTEDESWADGDWDGHPFWFRPAWDHPVTEADDWTQWGNDRHDGIVWRWDGHDWQRFGRADNAPAGKPYLPAPIGPGVFKAPADNSRPVDAPDKGVPQAPASTQAPAGAVPGSATAPNAVTPQGATRPRFDNSRPNSVNGPAAPSTVNATAPASTGTTNDRTSTRTNTSTSDSGPAASTSDTGSTTSATTARERSSDTPDRSTVRDRSSSSDSGSSTGSASTSERGSRQQPTAGQN